MMFACFWRPSHELWPSATNSNTLAFLFGPSPAPPLCRGRANRLSLGILAQGPCQFALRVCLSQGRASLLSFGTFAQGAVLTFFDCLPCARSRASPLPRAGSARPSPRSDRPACQFAKPASPSNAGGAVVQPPAAGGHPLLVFRQRHGVFSQRPARLPARRARVAVKCWHRCGATAARGWAAPPSPCSGSTTPSSRSDQPAYQLAEPASQSNAGGAVVPRPPGIPPVFWQHHAFFAKGHSAVQLA